MPCRDASLNFTDLPKTAPVFVFSQAAVHGMRPRLAAWSRVPWSRFLDPAVWRSDCATLQSQPLVPPAVTRMCGCTVDRMYCPSSRSDGLPHGCNLRHTRNYRHFAFAGSEHTHTHPGSNAFSRHEIWAWALSWFFSLQTDFR